MEDVGAAVASALKRERTSAKKAAETLEQVAAALRRARAGELTPAGLRDALAALDAGTALREDHKLVHAAISKVGKAIDKLAEASAGTGSDAALLSPGQFDCT